MRNEKETLEILKDALVGKILTLRELNSKCIEITEDKTEDIRNYKPEEYADNEGGSFAWSSRQDQKGIYNVEFSIEDKDEEDFMETAVEVLDVRIV